MVVDSVTGASDDVNIAYTFPRREYAFEKIFEGGPRVLDAVNSVDQFH